jgi:hypothetical protein
MSGKYQDIDIDGERAIERMLEDGGYASVEEWALDSNYWYVKDHDSWHDDEGYEVDIEWQACTAAYEAGYFHTGGK